MFVKDVFSFVLKESSLSLLSLLMDKSCPCNFSAECCSSPELLKGELSHKLTVLYAPLSLDLDFEWVSPYLSISVLVGFSPLVCKLCCFN